MQAHTSAPLGTLLNARSQGGPGIWRGQAWHGRAGQAFELREPGVMDGTTANSSPRTAAGRKQDDQIVKTKPLTRSCLRFLDQSLGPTRARFSRNRPLEQPCTMWLGCARVDWTSGHSLPFELMLHRTPDPDVDALCLVTRQASRNAASDPTASPFSKERRTWFINASNKTLATAPFPSRVVGRS